MTPHRSHLVWRMAFLLLSCALLELTLDFRTVTAETSDNLYLLCEQASQRAAAETGVPVSVLKAIALTETGRIQDGTARPWPWTVNMEGQGVWFESREEALAYANTHFEKGARSFDVGCFQINYKWHHQAFSSIDEMFDPVTNARYAAGFLKQLYSEKGSWEAAAGAYHSRTPSFAERYIARFSGYRAQFLHEDGQPIELAAMVLSEGVAKVGIRVNTFPLLQAGGGGFAIGSLVPLEGTSHTRSLFGG